MKRIYILIPLAVISSIIALVYLPSIFSSVFSSDFSPLSGNRFFTESFHKKEKKIPTAVCLNLSGQRYKEIQDYMYKNISVLKSLINARVHLPVKSLATAEGIKKIRAKSVRWLKPEKNMHITLKVFGRCCLQQRKIIDDVLFDIADSFGSFTLTIPGKGLRAWCTGRKLFIVMPVESEQLYDLARQIITNSALQGFMHTRYPFVGHITLVEITLAEPCTCQNHACPYCALLEKDLKQVQPVLSLDKKLSVKVSSFSMTGLTGKGQGDYKPFTKYYLSKDWFEKTAQVNNYRANKRIKIQTEELSTQ